MLGRSGPGVAHVLKARVVKSRKIFFTGWTQADRFNGDLRWQHMTRTLVGGGYVRGILIKSFNIYFIYNLHEKSIICFGCMFIYK